MDPLTKWINRTPFGLLDALGLKQLGRNPASLAEVVSPTIDLWENYYVGQEEFTTDTVNRSTLGFTVFPNTLVPAGEMWMLIDSNVLLTGAAGTTAICGAEWGINGASWIPYLASQSGTVAAAAETRYLNFAHNPMMILPQHQLAFRVLQISAAVAVSAQAWVRFARFTI